MPTTPNIPAVELDLGTYTTNAAATPYDTAFFDQLLASEIGPSMPDLPPTLDWDNLAATACFDEPICADPFVQGGLDETLCAAPAMLDAMTFDDFLNL